MKKIGILYGQERTFPNAFLEHGRAQAPSDIQFEPVRIGGIQQGRPEQYDVIIDRISQDVPFYRAALKHAALTGTAVINNPFWWSAEDKLTANVMAADVGVPVPKTVLLPSKDHPDDTTLASFTNLAYPLPWQEMFDHVGFPAFMKPNTGGGWKSVYKVHSPQELFGAYNETAQLNMLLQESITFDSYYRCYGIGGKYVRIMRYAPGNAFHERYVRNAPPNRRRPLQDPRGLRPAPLPRRSATTSIPWSWPFATAYPTPSTSPTPPLMPITTQWVRTTSSGSSTPPSSTPSSGPSSTERAATTSPGVPTSSAPAVPPPR